MLPDFPYSKRKIHKAIHQRLEQLQRELHPVLARVGRYVQHEGRTTEFEQVGYGRKSQEATQQSVAIEIRLEEVPTLVGDTLENKLRMMANEMGGLKVKMMFEHIADITEMTGNRIDAKGEKLSGKLLLDMMEAAEEDFDRFGNSKSSFVVHPDMLPELKRINDEVENDPEHKRRLESIQREKRKQWVDRESRRKLVD